VATIKVCKGEIFSLYTNLNTKFKSNAFEAYKAFVGARHESIIIIWVTYLNIGVEHLASDVNQQYIWATHLNLEIDETRFVIEDVYAQVEVDYASSFLHLHPFLFCNLFYFCIFHNHMIRLWNMMWVSLNARVANCLIKELEGRFLAHGLMDNLGVGYP